MAGIAVAIAASTAVLAVPGLPGWAMALIVLTTGLVNSVTPGVRWGLLHEVLPAGRFLLGRSVFNIAVSVMQIVGYAAGGLLLVMLSPRQALLVASGLSLLAAVITRLGLTERPPRAEGRPSIRKTWQVNGQLWASPARRVTYLAMWVPNGLIVGCEALFVPYAPTAASPLFVVTALGMLIGNIVVGRLLPRHYRLRLTTPLQILLAVPFLLFALPLPRGVALIAVALAAIGYSAGLLLQERLIAQTGDDIRGQALGLHSAGLLTMQAVCATLAGAIAQFLPVGTAMAVMALASLCASTTLAVAMRRPVTDSAHVG
jgi:predicted MFS family arabinose efflux permease